MSSVVERAKLVRANVFEILSKFPETRDSDRRLLLRYWNHVDGLQFDFTFPEQFATTGTSAESITRARRQIQKEGHFVASQEVLERREESRSGMREYFIGSEVSRA
jgi:hypothetical protein